MTPLPLLLFLLPSLIGKSLFFEHFPITTGRSDDLSFLEEKLRIWEVLHHENTVNVESFGKEDQLMELLNLVGRDILGQKEAAPRKKRGRNKTKKSSQASLPERMNSVQTQIDQKDFYVPKLAKFIKVKKVTRKDHDNIKNHRGNYSDNTISPIHKRAKEMTDFRLRNQKFMPRSGRLVVKRKKISKDSYSSGPRLQDNEVQTDSIIKQKKGKKSFNPQYHREKNKEESEAILTEMKQRKFKRPHTPFSVRQVNRTRISNRPDLKVQRRSFQGSQVGVRDQWRA